MIMKKFLLFASLSLLLVLFACSNEESSNAVNEEPKEEQVVLNTVLLGATWGEATRELAKEYEELTGVKVNVELVGRDAIYQRLALAIAGEAEYDLFNVDYNWVPEFANAGSLHPLDEFIEKHDVNLNEFLPRALALGQWNGNNGEFGAGGTTYGIPQTIHPHLLWYRSDLFNDESLKNEFQQEYGYELVPPQTMDQFRDAAEFFHGKEVGDNTLSGWAAQASRGFGNVHTWLSFVYSNGGDVIDWNNMESSLTTPEVVEATETWVELLEYSPRGINEYTFAEVSADASAGNLAMAIHWSWSSFEVDDPSMSQTVGKWEFAPIPKMETSVPHLAGWVNVIPKTSKHPEEAFKFLAWLQNQENDVRQAQMGAGDPVRIDSYSNEALTDLTLEGTDVKRFRRYEPLEEAMETAMARPFFPHEERWESIVSEYLSAVQVGQITVEEALERANDAVNNMLSDNY